MARARLRRRWASRVASAAASCALGFIFGICIYFGNPQQGIGGVDLAEYCSVIGHGMYLASSAGGDYCAQPVNVDLACQWQYRMNNLRGVFVSNDPNSMICESGSIHYAQGVTDMLGFCQYRTGIADMAAEPDPAYRDKWECREAVNVDAACDFEYRAPGLQGRYNSGLWECYRPMFPL